MIVKQTLVLFFDRLSIFVDLARRNHFGLVRSLESHRSVEARIVFLLALAFSAALDVFLAASTTEGANAIAAQNRFPDVLLRSYLVFHLLQVIVQLSLGLLNIFLDNLLDVLNLSKELTQLNRIYGHDVYKLVNIFLVFFKVLL